MLVVLPVASSADTIFDGLTGVAGLLVGLTYFPTLHGALTALPIVGPLLS